MARATGYKCDKCGAFVVSEKDNQLPPGWADISFEGNNGNGLPSHTQVCSPRCIVEWGKARFEAVEGKPYKAIYRYPRKKAEEVTE